MVQRWSEFFPKGFMGGNPCSDCVNSDDTEKLVNGTEDVLEEPKEEAE